MSTAPRAMILAAGYGTRLGALGRLKPKPMLPIVGTPLVRWSLLWLRHHGIREFVINLHHLGDQIEAELGDGRSLGVDIVYSHEEGMVLGTGGGLRHARRLLTTGRDEPIIVVNGKILTDLDLEAVLNQHRVRRAEATMVLRDDSSAERWGSLQVDASGRIVRLLGDRPSADPQAEPVGRPKMFTGVHILQSRCLDRIPSEGQQCILRSAYRALFNEGEGLDGYVMNGYWWEHSTPERYLMGVKQVLDRKIELPFSEHPTTGVHETANVHANASVRGPVWIGPHVEIEGGAQVGPFAQIGAGSRVRAGVRVVNAIVWDRADVRDDAIETVVTS